MINQNKNFGVSLIEIVVSLSVIITLTAGIVLSFSTFRNTRVLETAADEILSVISEARAKTLNSENDNQYGVHFETAQIALFRGGAYSESDGYNKVTPLSSLVEVSSIALGGGGADLVFKRLSGKTDNSGAVTVRLKSDAAKTKVINIGPAGIANIQ